jgi:hypothetical protein
MEDSGGFFLHRANRLESPGVVTSGSLRRRRRADDASEKQTERLIAYLFIRFISILC